LKNLSSFKAARKGIEYEFSRQVRALSQGEKLRQETRGWDEDKEQSYLMRVKEDAHDYRYFPDPDLPPLKIDSAFIETMQKTMAELPRDKKDRFGREFGLNEVDSDVICAEAPVADYFESIAKACGDGKTAANWVMGEVLRELKGGGSIAAFPIREDRLSALIKLVQTGKITNTIGKKVFEEMLTSSESPEKIVESKGWLVVNDDTAIVTAIEEVFAENKAQVQQYLSGKEQVMGFLVGQTMRRMKGKANPAVLNRLMKEKLDAMKNGG